MPCLHGDLSKFLRILCGSSDSSVNSVKAWESDTTLRKCSPVLHQFHSLCRYFQMGWYDPKHPKLEIKQDSQKYASIKETHASYLVHTQSENRTLWGSPYQFHWISMVSCRFLPQLHCPALETPHGPKPKPAPVVAKT